MEFSGGAGTVVGNHYAANFDAFYLDAGLPLAVVADGMGDSAGSAFAGRASVEGFTETLRAAAAPHSPAALRQAVALLHDSVREFARDHPGLAGCTLTALVGDAAGGAWVVQIGDSRLYRLRHDVLELLTSDHTAAWVGLLHGWFAYESAAARAARYRLTRYIGHPDAPEPDVLHVSFRHGDVYLLCTDGVADQLPYEQIRETLLTPSSAVDRLLAATLTAGGADNATAIVIRTG
ncbi:protein phosphatase 2C domain-containing protein [Actinoplanes sp. NPDC051411]|uniref:PP2C family protein-serine/threonine phosphatase n=1 Tax=Actinoplanes sp. NPDC051411 TaxID=3155522 RepID=UPI00344ABC1B